MVFLYVKIFNQSVFDVFSDDEKCFEIILTDTFLEDN
jgi:hypothetical protein